MLFICILIILVFKKLIKMLFKSFDHHILFRSFFCLFISTLSMGISIINWNILLKNPLETNNLSLVSNNLMLGYMIIDTIHYLYKQNYRIDLLLHHFVCLLIFGLHLDKNILSFCSINEILSSFNWIGIIYPNLEWISKILRLLSILFVRLFVWIFTLFFLSNSQPRIFQIAFILVFFFVCLDVYWIGIIIKNCLGYKNIIKENIKITG